MKDELDGSPRVRIARDFTALVSGEPSFEIVRVTYIVGAVAAAEDIDVEAHATHSCGSSFDRLRTSGWGARARPAEKAVCPARRASILSNSRVDKVLGFKVLFLPCR